MDTEIPKAKPTQDDESIRQILSNITYDRHAGWHHVLRYDHNRPYIQIQYTDTDPNKSWSGRKWTLSYFMKTSEVVRTVFKAYVAAENHEIEEFFKYKGVEVFGPHFDVEHIVRAVQNHTLDVDVRDDGMQGA